MAYGLLVNKDIKQGHLANLYWNVFIKYVLFIALWYWLKKYISFEKINYLLLFWFWDAVFLCT